MNTIYLIIPVFLVLVILGADLAVIFSGPQRSKEFQNKHGSGYDRTVKNRSVFDELLKEEAVVPEEK